MPIAITYVGRTKHADVRCANSGAPTIHMHCVWHDTLASWLLYNQEQRVECHPIATFPLTWSEYQNLGTAGVETGVSVFEFRDICAAQNQAQELNAIEPMSTFAAKDVETLREAFAKRDLAIILPGNDDELLACRPVAMIASDAEYADFIINVESSFDVEIDDELGELLYRSQLRELLARVASLRARRKIYRTCVEYLRAAAPLVAFPEDPGELSVQALNNDEYTALWEMVVARFDIDINEINDTNMTFGDIFSEVARKASNK